jgi:hypothetical protein
VVQHEKRFYQVERQSRHHAPAKGKVKVYEEEDGSLEIRYREQKLKWKEIAARPVSAKGVKETPARTVPPTALNPKWKPGPEHPWRRGYAERQGVEPALPTPARVPSLWASASAPP